MEWVNITARTLPEAIDLALENLGVDESEAEIEVLEEPRQGLFGRTRGNARVRARVKPKSSRPKVERGRTRKRRSEGGEEPAGRSRSTGRARGAGRKDSDSDDDGGPAGGSEKAAAVATIESEPGGEAAGGEARGGADRSRSRGNRSRSRGGSGGAGSNGRGGEGQDRETAQEATVEQVSSQLEEFLSGLTVAFGYESPVGVAGDDDDEGIIGSVEGRYGLMVGPKGRTLEAIQELARVSVQRSAPSNVRIKVDIGGYRQLRREALEAFALEAAAAVRLDGRERLLEPMNSADRKIVHDTLSTESGIETRSAGNEPNRRVVVLAATGGAATPTTTGDDADEGEDNVDTASLNGAEPVDADAGPESAGGAAAGASDATSD